MKQTKLIMGMPITVEVLGPAEADIFDEVFSYFEYVDEKFSPFKEESEVSRLNTGELAPDDWSDDVRLVFDLAEQTKRDTNGYFDIRDQKGRLDPSGLVKGWAIRNAARLIRESGFEDFYVEAGGDIEVGGRNSAGEAWRVGIRDPFGKKNVVKTVHLQGSGGVATSGSYERGDHVWNPKDRSQPIREIVSLTVIGPDVYEADRFATAAFAMGREGIKFIEGRPGLEGYSIDREGIATMTSGFRQYSDVA